MASEPTSNPELYNKLPQTSVTKNDAGVISITGNVGEGAKNINIGKNISQVVVEGNVMGNFITTFVAMPDPQLIRARKILLENVAKFWVEGVLKRSLHNEVFLSLGLQERSNAVDNRPWDIVLQTPQHPDRLLPPGTKIMDVFDQHHQNLLILGAPGSGKTTMLLELARDLIARAQHDVNCPIPVVLNLSSWVIQQQLLEDWVVSEINSKYSIPIKIAQRWVDTDALLLLLDGLDEVQSEYRSMCVGAINAFRKTHVLSLAVCSRSEDYEALEQQLQLQSAVLLQPLSLIQIDEYFKQLGVEYKGIRVALQKDDVLWELAQSPLILSIMTVAYQGNTADALAQLHSPVSYRKNLFDSYIKRILSHRGRVQPYLPHTTLHWLTWLARNMLERQQSIFLLRQLQPDWLKIRFC